MSEVTETGAQPGEDANPSRAVAVRERTVTHSPVAIWDSADFEQMQRVGVVLARSGLVPESLCKGKWIDPETNREVEGFLNEQVVAARCVLICNQARLWGADPLNVLQCTSLINGRLMYEGKLVNAIVQHLTGVKLRFELGRWNTDHFEPTDERSGLAEALAIRCFDPEDPAREVTGSVGMWKTTRAGNPWTNAGNWPRQLRYRAAREWARAYEPGAILGILAEGDQEIEDTATVAPRGPGVMDRLPGNQHAEGFDTENGTATTEVARAGVRGKRAARKAAAETAALPPPEAGVVERPTSEEAATETAGVPSVEPGQDTQASAEAASEPSAEAGADSSPSLPADAAAQMDFKDVIAAGYPVPDEIYMLNGDEWVWNAERGHVRRDTYKNGEPFSEAGRDKAYSIYEDHAPAGQAAPEVEAEVVEEGDSFPPEFDAYIKVTETATAWAEVKTALATFQKTGVWSGFHPDQQNNIRAQTWATLEERAVEWLPDPGTDVSAFRLWLEDQDDAGEIRGGLEAITGHADYPGKPEALRANVEAAAAARIKLLEE